MSEITSQEDGKTGSFICIAVYINPGNSEQAKRARKSTLKELQNSLKALHEEFKDPPILIAGDFNKVGMDKL